MTRSDPPRPIEQCYWVVPGRLLAGEYPRDHSSVTSSAKLQALLDAGVSRFIDLTEEHELLPYAILLDEMEVGRISHERFPIRDQDVPGSREEMTAILDAIDDEMRSGGIVYVHCWGGVGRTGTVVGCWLGRHGVRGQAALDRLQQLWRSMPKAAWRQAPETRAQESFVREWNESPD